MSWEINYVWTLIYTRVWMAGTRCFSMHRLDHEKRVKSTEGPWKCVDVWEAGKG